MTELIDIFNDISNELKERFNLIISICNSPIEKIFIAKLYRFFFIRRFPIDIISYDAETLILEKQCDTDGYDPNNDYYKSDLNVGHYKHPLTNIEERISGIIIKGININYKIYPQKPIYNHTQCVYADFALIITDKTNKIIGKFVIECDGFRWHSTREQLNKDNLRSRFLTLHGYRIIRYTGQEISYLTDIEIIKLDNIIYHSIFAKESPIYIWEVY